MDWSGKTRTTQFLYLEPELKHIAVQIACVISGKTLNCHNELVNGINNKTLIIKKN